MKTYLLLALFSLIAIGLKAQNATEYRYEPSTQNPFGLPNPEAPPQTKDYESLIGECQCKSIARLPDQTWGDTTAMTWRFKYIMNGYGIQDETLKADGTYSGSIRQFNADSAKWYVHYYSSKGIPNTLPAWEGGKTDESTMVLYRDSTAPNGTPGFYRITFKDISSTGFNWTGEWVNKDETIQYPMWNIFCKKRN